MFEGFKRLQSAMGLLCRTHSVQSAMGLLWRTQAALSVFSCSGFRGVKKRIWHGISMSTGKITFDMEIPCQMLFRRCRFDMESPCQMLFLKAWVSDLTWNFHVSEFLNLLKNASVRFDMEFPCQMFPKRFPKAFKRV